MTRINTNVSSLTAQKSLARANQSLQEALTRLSTGLRINTGKDDPAGLIASEVLRTDIISVERAISNSERANQVIATADSALGQVSSLLNDIRGLVTEAANEGAMSTEQIAANQLQIDSSLEAINRIAQTTTFQGRKLLDGSFSFITTATQNFDDVTDLEINQANLGATDRIDVEIEIAQAAAKAQITNATNVDAKASTTLSFGTGFRLKSQTGDGEVAIALTGTKTAPQVKVAYTDLSGSGGTPTAVWASDVLTITLDDQSTTTAAEIATAVSGAADVYAYVVNDSATFAAAGEDYAAKNMEASTITIEAKVAGPDLNNMAVVFATSGTQTATPGAAYDADSNTLTITVDSDLADETLLTAIESAIEGISAATSHGGFTATVSTGANSYGRTTIVGDDTDVDDIGVTGDTLYTGGGVLKDDLAFTLGGKLGVEVFSFQQYTKIADVVAAVNLVSDATGVTATDDDGTLQLDSASYGSSAFVTVNVISEGAAGTFETNLSATRATGQDIDATVNGYSASGDGNTLSVNTATLDFSATVAAGATDTIQFSIVDGGALFQLGPEVVSNQQARLGIQGVNTAQLRGETGRLYEIGSGESAALATDATTAAQIVDEVIAKVTSLRGRLGAFQKTTLEPNIASLNDTLETLTEAESSIRDADFAAETASLTRAQILVQSGVSVVAIANSNPQNILSLLR